MLNRLKRALPNEPLPYGDKRLLSSDMTALIAVLVVGGPALAVGARMGSSTADGGLGLSITQLLLIVPIGCIVGALLLGLTAWVGSHTSLPGTRSARPAFGSIGSWVVSLLRLVLLMSFGALALGEVSRDLSSAAERVGYPVPVWVVVTVLTLAAAALIAIGPKAVVSRFVRVFVFWVAGTMVVLLAFRVLESVNLSALFAQAPGSGMMLALDAMVGMSLLWWPFISDVSRYADSESASSGGVGYGFAVPALAMVLLGAVIGAANLGDLGPSGSALGFVFPGAIGLLALVLWALSVELDGIYSASYSGTVSISSQILRAPAWVIGALVLALIAAAALMLAPQDLIGGVDLGIAFAAPLAAVVLTDFFFVRLRDYSLDDLFVVAGQYPVINVWGWIAAIVGFVTSQLLGYAGPSWFDIEALLPLDLADTGLPPLIFGMALSAAIYVALGRAMIRRKIYVARVRQI